MLRIKPNAIGPLAFPLIVELHSIQIVDFGLIRLFRFQAIQPACFSRRRVYSRNSAPRSLP